MNSDFETLFAIYKGKTVFITGHTGFKGTWLALLLKHFGATVVGYALPPSTKPNLFALTQMESEIVHIEGDICDYSKLKNAMDSHRPDILFHLAAQPIVLESYENPKRTFDVNAGGTVNALEALRETQHTKACVVVTTDKCYENKNWPWGYRENDSLGGKDPYSASKSMAELAVEAYRSSFFSKNNENPLLIATARAGNIIGGGDFSPFRIVPDCVRALSAGVPIQVRHPQSARPWLYVLDALSGYLHLGARLLQGDALKAEAWNFGPKENRAVTVQELVEFGIKLWGSGEWEDPSRGISTQKMPAIPAKEMPSLSLNWDKAANSLGWEPLHEWKVALIETIHWHIAHNKGSDMRSFCMEQIENYIYHELTLI